MKLLLVALVLLLCAVAVAGVVDHREKQRRINRAELAEWYCTHEGTRCGGVSSDNIERRWNEREVAYKGTLGVLAVAVGASALGFRLRRS